MSYNETSKVYLFQNIRYAQPPTGSLRFRAPAVPKTDRSAVRNGSELSNCSQGIPAWQAKAYGPVRKFSNPSVPFNLTAWEDAIATTTIPNLELNAETAEDCLFLDVHVPKRILDGSKQDFRSSGQPSGGAPVLVWVRNFLSHDRSSVADTNIDPRRRLYAGVQDGSPLARVLSRRTPGTS